MASPTSSTPSSRYADVARLNRAMLRTGEARAKELKELDRKSAPPAIRATALNYLGDIARDAKKTVDAIGYYTRAAEVSPSNEVGRLANLKCATLLSESTELDDRFRALKIYLGMAESDDPALAAESLFSAVQSPSAVILEPKKVQSDTVSTVSPSICREVMGPDAMIFVF